MSHEPSPYKRGSPFMREEEFIEYLNKPTNCPPVLTVHFQEWKSLGYIQPVAVENGVNYYRDDIQVSSVRKIKQLERLDFNREFMQEILPRLDQWYIDFHSLHQPTFVEATWRDELRRFKDGTVYGGLVHADLLGHVERVIDARADSTDEDRISLDLLEQGQCLIFQLIDETVRRIQERVNHAPELEEYRLDLSRELLYWLLTEKTLFTGCPKSRSHIISLEDVFLHPENYEYTPGGRAITCNFTRAGITCGHRFDFTDRPWRPLRWIEGRKQVCLECLMAFDLANNRYRSMSLCPIHQRQREGGVNLRRPIETLWRLHLDRVVANLWYSPP